MVTDASQVASNCSIDAAARLMPPPTKISKLESQTSKRPTKVFFRSNLFVLEFKNCQSKLGLTATRASLKSQLLNVWFQIQLIPNCFICDICDRLSAQPIDCSLGRHNPPVKNSSVRNHFSIAVCYRCPKCHSTWTIHFKCEPFFNLIKTTGRP